MSNVADSGQSPTVIRYRPAERALMWLGFPVAGAIVAWLVKLIADWVAGLAWAPLQGLFKLVASIDEPQATIGAIAVGAIGGLAVAALGEHEGLTVRVDDAEIELTRLGKSRTFPVDAVVGAFVDGKDFALLGADGLELAREKTDLATDSLRAGLTAHGVAWLADGDPHAKDYHRWVEDTPDLPATANAFLKARAKALSKKDEEEAAELYYELLKLGVVVRAAGQRQYWRRPTSQ